MDIYIHRTNGREQRRVEGDAKVGDLRDGDATTSVWLENEDEPLDAERLLSEVASEGTQFHVSKCHRVDVRVRFNGDDKTRAFAPAVTVGRVFDWACGKDGFDLPPAEKAKHTFQVCGQKTQPDKADHIGTFADGDCQVCFDLVPKEKFEG
jgi:hypothetical protein